MANSDLKADRSPRLCLNMIVKNERTNIERCLTAVADHIACWVIGDTGSSDGTQEIIRTFFAARNIPGELHSFPFETFDQARNEALCRARASILEYEYLLMVDADMELKVSDPKFRRLLEADAYQVVQESGVYYWNTRLVRRDAQARYVGVTHEYIEIKEGEVQTLSGVSFIDYASGANRPGKFARDAALLRQALKTEQDPGLRARYTFYLANSLRDDGDKTGALEQFLKRSCLGYWSEEIYVSLTNAGHIKAELGYPVDEVIATFEEATAVNPLRAEALHGAARFCRDKGLHERGYHLAARSESISAPQSGLFIAEWIYRYGALDELAIASYWTGRYAESMSLCDRLLAEPDLPEEYRARVRGNRQHALDKLVEERKAAGNVPDRFTYMLQAARQSEVLSQSVEQVVSAYLAAAECDTGRAEALHGVSRFCRYKQLHARGYQFAMRGLAILDGPHERVPEEAWIYDYGLLDELSVHAYWTGRYEVCVQTCDRLLNEGKIPIEMRERVLQNRQFAADRLKKSASFTTHSENQPTVPELEPSAFSLISTALSKWGPTQAQGGTELMASGLRERLGNELDTIDLCINTKGIDKVLPSVVWIHHDINQAAVQWLDDSVRVAGINRFVFVSDWQRRRFIERFRLPSGHCHVLRNATAVPTVDRQIHRARPLRLAYASTPYRGLSVLLDAWERAWDRLDPHGAELHIWSSHKLYGPSSDDTPYMALYARATALPGVTYHGIAPNAELRRALGEIDILAYPSTFAETSCLVAIEAMAAGCRIICPDLGALPETTAGFARLYPYIADPVEHAQVFADLLVDEVVRPWAGTPGLAKAQQQHARMVYDWPARIAEWRGLIADLSNTKAPVFRIEQGCPTGPSYSVFGTLARLRERGFSPTGILDVGAHDGAFARGVRQVFPAARILMIDALTEKASILEEVCRDIGNADFAIALLGDEEKPSQALFVVDTQVRPDLMTTGSSKFRENANFPMHERIMPQRRLEAVAADHIGRFELVKLDVQGAELDVLKGLGDALENVEVVLAEISLVAYNEGAPLIDTVITQMHTMGFCLYDIVDFHRYHDGALLQIDGLFVRSNSVLRPRPPFWS